MAMDPEMIIKTEKLRKFIRELYIYGFKSREQMENSSSFKNYKILIENILAKYMEKNKIGNKTAHTINFDSREMEENPLHKIWKVNTFTLAQIKLFFYILNYLQAHDTVTIDEIAEYIGNFGEDDSIMDNLSDDNIKKNMKEFVDAGWMGSISGVKEKTKYYLVDEYLDKNNLDALSFFSEHAPCSVVGSYIIDSIVNLDDIDKKEPRKFRFKHHFIADTMDSEIEYKILKAIRDKKIVNLELYKSKMPNENNSSGDDNNEKVDCIPLTIIKSVTMGREYMQAYVLKNKKIMPFRLSNIKIIKNVKKIKNNDGKDIDIKNIDVAGIFNREHQRFNDMKEHIWTINGDYINPQLKHIDFTIAFRDDEEYIYDRMVREKRCGTVTRLDKNHAKFQVEVYDSWELKPWIYTFIGRIVELNSSDKNFKSSIKNAFNNLYAKYGI